MKRALLTVAILAISALSAHLMAGTIIVKLVWEDGTVCNHACKISNGYNFKEVCTDGNGVARVDVGSATDNVQIYVGGVPAACARSGDSVTVRVKSSGLTGAGVEAKDEVRCD